MSALVVIKAFSVVLALGSISLFLFEWKHYQNSLRATDKEEDAADRKRFLRRAVGAVMLFIASILIFGGRLPQPGEANPQELVGLFNYWLGILGITLLVGLIALLDILSGIKKIRSTIALDNARELALIEEHLKSSIKS